MKTRTVLMTVLALLVCVTMSFAQSPQMGTWKLR